MKIFLQLYLESYLGLPRKAWYLALAQLVNSSGTMVIFFLTIYLTVHHSYTIALAGQIVSAFGIGMMVGSLMGGVIVDGLGAHRTQRIALFMTGGLLLVMSQVSFFPILWAIALLWGVFNGALFPANSSAMAAECPPEVRSRGFSLIRLANNLGMTASPIVGGFLAKMNYVYLFYADGLTCILAALLLLYLFPHEASLSLQSTPGKKTNHSLLRHGRLWATFFSALGLTIIVSQIFTTWPPFLRSEEGLQEYQIGLLLAISTTMIVIMQMPVSHRASGYSHYATASVGAFLYSLAFILMSVSHGIIWQIVALMIWTTGEMLVFPSLMTAISHLAPEGYQGKYQGVYSLSFSLGMVIGPAGGSYLAEAIGWQGLWAAVAFIAAASSLSLYLINRVRSSLV